MTDGITAAYDGAQEEMERKRRREKISRDPDIFCRKLKQEISYSFDEILLVTRWLDSLAEKLGTTSDLTNIEARIDSLLKGEKLVGDALWRTKICEALHITTWASDDEIETRLVAIGVVTGQAEVLANKRVEIPR